MRRGWKEKGFREEGVGMKRGWDYNGLGGEKF